MCRAFEISQAWDLHFILSYLKLYFYSLSVLGLLSEHSNPALWGKKKERGKSPIIDLNKTKTYEEVSYSTGFGILAALCKTSAGTELHHIIP